MIYEAIDTWNSPSLEHHGVKGMKWGVRKAYHNVMAKHYRKAAVRAENRANRFKQNGKNGIYWVSENEAKEGAAIAKIDKKNFEKKAKAHENWEENDRRKEQEKLSKMAPAVRKQYLAKQNYKAAKKEYNKAFNKWYYANPLNGFTASGRQKNSANFQNSLVKAGDLAAAKGKYISAKGVVKSNPKLVNKGKRMVETAKNTKKYNAILLSDIQKGYTYDEAVKRRASTRDKLVQEQKKIDAKYRLRREDISSNRYNI